MASFVPWESSDYSPTDIIDEIFSSSRGSDTLGSKEIYKSAYSSSYASENYTQRSQETDENLNASSSTLKQCHMESQSQRSESGNNLQIDEYKAENEMLLNVKYELKKDIANLKRQLRNSVPRTEHDCIMKQQTQTIWKLKTENQILKAIESKDLEEINNLKMTIAELTAKESSSLRKTFDKKILGKNKNECGHLRAEIKELKRQLKEERQARNFLNEEREKDLQYQFHNQQTTNVPIDQSSFYPNLVQSTFQQPEYQPVIGNQQSSVQPNPQQEQFFHYQNSETAHALPNYQYPVYQSTLETQNFNPTLGQMPQSYP